MRKLALLVSLFLTFGSTSNAEVCRILALDRGSVTVELTTGEPILTPLEDEGRPRIARVELQGFLPFEVEGRPLLPFRRFLFEVTSKQGVRLEVLESEIDPIEGLLPAVFLADGGSMDDHRRALSDPSFIPDRRFARFTGVGVYRHRNIALIDFFPIVFDREGEGLLRAKRVVIRLSFPPVEGTPGKPGARIPGDRFIVNRGHVYGWGGLTGVTATSQRTPFEFSMSGNWLKIRIRERGIYCVTYNDLIEADVDPMEVNPSTLRLFSGGPLCQPADIGEGGSFEDDYHFTEHAILYRGSGSESFSWEDSVIFYGVGVEGWSNTLDPSLDRTQRYEHPYETWNVYWLTWGGFFSGDTVRMESRPVVVSGTPDTLIDSYEERLHVEDDILYDPIYTDDRWYWRRLRASVSSSFYDNFTLTDLAAPVGRVRSLIYGPYHYIPPAYREPYHKATYYVNSGYVDTLTWNVPGGYHPDEMGLLDREVSNLVSGENTFYVHFDNIYSEYEMYMLWYDVIYRRRLKAIMRKLDFFSPLWVGTAQFTITDLMHSAIYLFDVTSHEKPVLLTGGTVTAGNLMFEDVLDGSPRYYMAVAAPELRKPSMELVSVPPLRDESPWPHMVIIYHERFRESALDLMDYRSQHLPYAASPVVRAIDVEDVYNNFSGGLKDPIAIRNYLKFLYDNFTVGGDPVIKYALLVGNGNHDPRDILSKGTDYIPLYIDVFRGEYEGVEDEDYLTKLDDSGDRMPDIAIGRLTVLSTSEAGLWIQRIMDYEQNGDLGPWRNKVILVADDEFSTKRHDDFDFIVDAERMSSDPENAVLPHFLDFKKIYLREYPFVDVVKPAARNELINEWNDGALIVNYAGHGSPQQMSDERVMVKSDIYALVNGIRCPLLLAFSCSVGDFESPYQRSIGQDIVTLNTGGAIASMCGSGGTWAGPNTALNEAIFESLFTSRDSTGTEPIGFALQLAKVNCRIDDRNDSKYALLGDPALKLTLPAYKVEHDVSKIDTMYTGHRYKVEGCVKVGGEVFVSFNGKAEISIQEAQSRVEEEVMWLGELYSLKYSLPGRELFRGTFDVAAGRFDAEFVVPRRCKTGTGARIRSYLSDSGIDGVGACDSLLIVPAPPESIPVNGESPNINMYFSGQATRVKAGAKLIVEISDPDGIAILGTDPQSSILIEFDGSGFPIFITEYFEYDPGSSTAGKVEYPLRSDLEPGFHKVVVKAFDNLGAPASDTLKFEVVEKEIYTVSDVFNLPNPFSESTNFVFQLSSGARVHLSIFNLSGVKIWGKSTYADEGFNSIYWDGRDLAGDRLANGTYLYYMEIEFSDSFNRKETVKGKVVLLR